MFSLTVSPAIHSVDKTLNREKEREQSGDKVCKQKFGFRSPDYCRSLFSPRTLLFHAVPSGEGWAGEKNQNPPTVVAHRRRRRRPSLPPPFKYPPSFSPGADFSVPKYRWWFIKWECSPWPAHGDPLQSPAASSHNISLAPRAVAPRAPSSLLPRSRIPRHPPHFMHTGTSYTSALSRQTL